MLMDYEKVISHKDVKKRSNKLQKCDGDTGIGDKLQTLL